MPLTEKGEQIKASMEKQYGPEKGEEVFYASKNAGRITGVDKRNDQAQPAQKPQPQQQEPPVKETKTTVKEPAGEQQEEQDPKSKLKAAEDELDALEREQEQSEEGLGRQNAIEDQKKLIRSMRNEMRETEHKERMGIADAVELLEYQQDRAMLLKHIGDVCVALTDRMDAYAARRAKRA